MESKKFLSRCKLIRENLTNLVMDRTFNSIGSNVFFEFGEGKEIVHRNGKKTIEKDWSLWLANASWRITHNDNYVVGSGDSTEIIQDKISNLLGKKFQSMQFLSQFLDVEFGFTDGYRITSFFNWSSENQWTILMPKEESISIECETEENIKEVQVLSKSCEIVNNYKPLETPIKSATLIEVTFDEYEQPVFSFDNRISLSLNNCSWRFQKDDNYIAGCVDMNYLEDKSFFTPLIGKKITQVDVANSMMDARFRFEDQYEIKTFSCSKHWIQWTITKDEETLYEAKIKLDE